MKLATLLLLLVPAAGLAAGKTLDVYAIDVEGGKALLVVTPAGESMLVDVGFPKSANREASTDVIIDSLRAAGVKQLDYLLISHYDGDHVGDVPGLVARFPVKHLVDHGASPGNVKNVQTRYQPYAALYGQIDHIAVKVGDRLPLKGVDALVVTAAGKLIEKPLRGAGARNPACSQYQQEAAIEEDVEDDASVGVLYTLGKFRMLDLADLEAHNDYDLACPVDRIGPVNVLQVNVHGSIKGMSKVFPVALRPRVDIMGNGARKGAEPQTWPILRNAPAVEDIWQVHFSVAGAKDANPPEDFIANLDAATDQHKWIKLSAQPDGTFTVTNGRNGFSKTYKPRS
jgi:beta-lactamase superfamily II metal-dependent hydrolase